MIATETDARIEEQSPTAERVAATVAVRCRGVVKGFGDGANRALALRGAELEVHTGELLMLVGPSGCGKTTLISIIAGILDADEGECRVFGHDFTAMSGPAKTAFRAGNIGFVFQAYNLLPTLTAAENAAVPLLINGWSHSRAVAKAEEMLVRVGLSDRLRSYPAQLSGGQQQRVAIARSLVHDPRLLVCDEPTSALDGKTGQSVMELLRELAVGSDRALVIVTHDARTFHFADRIAEMNDGQVVRVVNSHTELTGH